MYFALLFHLNQYKNNYFKADMGVILTPYGHLKYVVSAGHSSGKVFENQKC